MNGPGPTEEEIQAELEAELAKLPPEQREALEREVEYRRVMDATPILPINFAVEPRAGADGSPFVLLTIMTPVFPHGVKFVLPRDAALALASQMRKAAQTGPELLVPPGAGRLVVPGR